MAFSTLFSFVALTLVGVSVAQEQCLLTETSCQCSSTVPSGTCLKSQGDGTCLLGRCDEGHKCDCFGYQKCSIKKCGKHIPVGGTRSETVPFQCKMEPDAGTCTEHVDFMETVSAAKNAESDATTSNDEATFTESAAVRVIDELTTEKKAVNQMMKEVESVADQIPPAELEEIEAEAKLVVVAVQKAGALMLAAVQEAVKVSEYTFNVRRFKRDAQRYQKAADEKKVELKAENEKKTQDKVKIEQLSKDITDLENTRAKVVKMCGKEAQNAKQSKAVINETYQLEVRERELARAANSRCMQKSQRALGEARSAKTERA